MINEFVGTRVLGGENVARSRNDEIAACMPWPCPGTLRLRDGHCAVSRMEATYGAYG